MCGRTVMVVVGRNIPVTLLDLEKVTPRHFRPVRLFLGGFLWLIVRVRTQALLYFIHVMDHITVKEYVMVYFHTLTAEHNHLDSDFLKNLHDIVDYKSVPAPLPSVSAVVLNRRARFCCQTSQRTRSAGIFSPPEPDVITLFRVCVLIRPAFFCNLLLAPRRRSDICCSRWPGPAGLWVWESVTSRWCFVLLLEA